MLRMVRILPLEKHVMTDRTSPPLCVRFVSGESTASITVWISCPCCLLVAMLFLFLAFLCLTEAPHETVPSLCYFATFTQYIGPKSMFMFL